MWFIKIHTREFPSGILFDKVFQTEKQAREFSNKHFLAWRYNGYCTFFKKTIDK